MSERPSLIVVQRLAKEAAEREARERSWDMVADILDHLDREQINVEMNPLYLGDNEPSSYLEQVTITLPEAYPGHGEPMRHALFMLLDLLPHLQRDRMTDEERIAVGWVDLQKNHTAVGEEV